MGRGVPREPIGVPRGRDARTWTPHPRENLSAVGGARLHLWSISLRPDYDVPDFPRSLLPGVLLGRSFAQSRTLREKKKETHARLFFFFPFRSGVLVEDDLSLDPLVLGFH